MTAGDHRGLGDIDAQLAAHRRQLLGVHIVAEGCQQPHIQPQHDAVAQRRGREEALHHRHAEPKHQHPPGPKGRAHRRRKGDEDAAVLLQSGQVAHGSPADDKLRKKPQTEQPLAKSCAGCQQKRPVPPTAQRKLHRARPRKGGQHPLGPLFVQLVGHEPGDRHREKARHRQRGEEGVGHHTDEEIPRSAGCPRPAAEQQQPPLEQHPQQHGPGADDARIAVGPQPRQHPLAAEQLFQFEPNSSHSSSDSVSFSFCAVAAVSA